MISIRWRLTIWLGIMVGLLFAVTGFGVFLAMRGVLKSRFDETLTAKANALITASEIDGGDFEIDLTVKDFAGFGKGGEDLFEIRRIDGGLFKNSPSLPKRLDAPWIIDGPREPADDHPRLVDGSLSDGEPLRFYIQRFYPKDDKRDAFTDLYLIVASPTRTLDQQLNRLGTILLVAGAAAVLLMVPLIRTGLARGLRPLDQLATRVRSIRPDDLKHRLTTESLPAELVPVAARLNEWIARLEDSFERERRFSSHAAHELRTPLAELRSMAELGATWPEESTPERCAAMVVVADQLTALLDKLALLARADAGNQPVTIENLQPGPAVDAVLARLSPITEARGLHVDLRIDGGSIATDPLLWNAVVQNLLGNAVSHAPAGSTISIETSPGHFLIRNPAPDLDQGDLPQLFDRFWRKDQSRGEGANSGLGLSIVKACVTLLGGSIKARLTPGHELEIEVLWNQGR